MLLLGDNPAVSFDSRQSGYGHADQVVGVVDRRLGGPSIRPVPAGLSGGAEVRKG
ncbi:hypothetical protein [Micromonospora sp. NBC_00421]|uniref:hypothetical protein n=1 Tax=Micromonospora sp. NBC_00421 TaxID=2975976 RepID=UPI002E208EE4